MSKQKKPQLWSVAERRIISVGSRSNNIIWENVFPIKAYIKNQEPIVKAK